MRIALLTFILLAGLGVAIGHAVHDGSQPRVEDRVASVRIKL